MTDGIEIYDVNGKLQFNGDMLTYVLRATGTAYVAATKVGNTSPTSLSIPTTDSYNQALVALGGGGGYGAAYAGTNGSGQRIYATNSAPVGTAFNYYIFERSSVIPPAAFGLEVRNASGQITFSSNQRVMSVLGMLGNPGALAANSPSFTASGRTLAFCQGAWAGHRTAGPIQSASNPNGPWTVDGNGAYHRYANNGKAYGARIPDDGQTVKTIQISWNDITIGPYTGNTIDPNFVIDLSLFIVDVTGIPIGQTYF